VTGFSAIFVPDELRDAVSDRAWLLAMVEAERALAVAGAAAGAVPADAAAAIAANCTPELLDDEDVVTDGRAVANPAEPLMRRLRKAVGADAADYVHFGATSQDIVDTGAMLVATWALRLVLGYVDELAVHCARLAREHRSTPMAGRTLLQQAVPTTFGLVCAGWLQAIEASRERLADEAAGLPAQLGGAAGTLAALGDGGLDVRRRFAAELGLSEPTVTWHSDRTPVRAVAAAAALCAGAAGKIGGDIILLSQTEIGEVAEGGDGASSTMPQKHNPAGSVRAVAAARRATADAATLLQGFEHELQRAAGAWQAEWEPFAGVLAYTGGAVACAAQALAGLSVDAGRMRANLDLSGGAIVAERIVLMSAARVGRHQASGVMKNALAAGPEGFADELDAEALGLSEAELAEALDPATYVGAAEDQVDLALTEYERRVAG
jgi:3-carboxy-cis,cis-muconate cycloisomerase